MEINCSNAQFSNCCFMNTGWDSPAGMCILFGEIS
jgi:hypothetical protein